MFNRATMAVGVLAGAYRPQKVPKLGSLLDSPRLAVLGNAAARRFPVTAISLTLPASAAGLAIARLL